MQINNFTKLLYVLLFINSFISGIFGIFIPLFLYNIGFSFSDISFFIAFNAISFFLFLFILERIISKINLNNLIKLTFFIYFLFISSIFFLKEIKYFIIIIAIFNGIYLCLFWKIHRLIFLKSINNFDIGKKFSNIQILIIIITQISILLGSIILEKFGFEYIYYLSSILIFLSFLLLSNNFKTNKGNNLIFKNYKAMSLKEILNFKDKYNSKLIFLIDGIFLFLESYFWLLIVFLYVKLNFISIGLIIVSIGIFFSIIYYFIRKNIDKSNSKKIFKIIILLYSFSWFLRIIFDYGENKILNFIIIGIIGFITILFRLVYNKIFFKIAKNTLNEKYIFLKSYYTQFVISIFFIILGYLFIYINQNLIIFKELFLISGIFSFLYFYQKVI